ncbi:DUF350 domain-containing protein [Alkalicoccus chagannorensis]|uniref:DUF350 domain-containing protein n=1 Tax=Alkalicoccus chagannorensis TaxID=427072 RepID=UPI0003F58C2A|nr:DUF350 domain-containing protein [Alkalicoccus chagannorensis]
MKSLFESEVMYTLGTFSAVVVLVFISLYLFELAAGYDTRKEIAAGNKAVALATAGKIFGLANIFQAALQSGAPFAAVLGWGFFGIVLLLSVYFMFEFMTPAFHVDEELASGNTAVGIIAFILPAAISFVIAAGL